QALGGRTLLGVQVGVAEAAAEPGCNRLWPEGHRRTLTTPLTIHHAAVQPQTRPTRHIGIELRPDGPLLYERLSDPILIRRAKDGDRRALAALCERHAPRVE